MRRDDWCDGFRSPTPDTEPASDAEPPNGKFPYREIPRDALLARELDLSSRYDPAVPQKNPFTIAAERAAVRVHNETSVKIKKDKPQGNIVCAVKKANAEPGEDGDEGKKNNEKWGRPPARRYTDGWVDQDGQPVASSRIPKDTDPKPPKKTKTSEDSGNATKRGARGGRQASEEKITFTRIRESIYTDCVAPQ